MRAASAAFAIAFAFCALAGARVNAETPVSAESLDIKQQRIVAIAASTATGEMGQLSGAFSRALDDGLTVNEIKEILIQLYAYTGFPRTLNGLSAFQTVLEERLQRGIRDETGPGPHPLPINTDSAKLGTEIQLRLTGAVGSEKYADFSPTIDTFLKAHLFGDIFGRDNLDFRTREIVTVSALAALDGLDAQLQSHLRIALRQGLTPSQLRHLVSVATGTVGRKRADGAAKVLGLVLSPASTDGAKDFAAAPETMPGTFLPIRVARGPRPKSEIAPEEHFVGVVRVDRLFQANKPARASGAYVAFEPGARTAWHSHPLGQTLTVTAGTGWVQQWGQQAQKIWEGDVVWIPPGVKHWHGATKSAHMTHLAIQEELASGTVTWMEQVSEDQYRGADPLERAEQK